MKQLFCDQTRLFALCSPERTVVRKLVPAAHNSGQHETLWCGHCTNFNQTCHELKSFP